MTNRKFPQLVSAEMMRFSDSKGNWHLDKEGVCYLVRNKTRIQFGKAENLIGTVIMTNPGSYGLDQIDGWEAFRTGKGNIRELVGRGYPDLTMQNVIAVVQSAFERCGKRLPTGYIEVLNISSVVCPKGKDVVDYHVEVSSFIEQHGLSKSLLENESVHIAENIIQTFKRSPFIIMGFVQKAFEDKVKNLMDIASEYPTKTITVLDQNNWPSHPRRWRTEKQLMNAAIEGLFQVI